MVVFPKKFLSYYINDPIHCVKSVRIRSYSGPHFPAFGLNTERYGVSLRTQSECGKMRTRITPKTDTFHAVILLFFFHSRRKRNKRRTRYRQLRSADPDVGEDILLVPKRMKGKQIFDN